MAALFVLLTALAVLAGMARPVWPGEVPYLFLICGGLTGFFVGMMHAPRLRGVVLGVLIGTLISASIGPALNADEGAVVKVTVIGVLGSAIVVILGVLSRSARPERFALPEPMDSPSSDANGHTAGSEGE